MTSLPRGVRTSSNGTVILIQERQPPLWHRSSLFSPDGNAGERTLPSCHDAPHLREQGLQRLPDTEIAKRGSQRSAAVARLSSTIGSRTETAHPSAARRRLRSLGSVRAAGTSAGGSD